MGGPVPLESPAAPMEGPPLRKSPPITHPGAREARLAATWAGPFLLAFTFLTACAAVPSLREAYEHRKDEFPVTIYWNYVRQDTSTLVAQGIARNDLARKFQFTHVMATLLGLDQHGRIVSRSVERVPDFIGLETPFRVVLRLEGSEQAFDLRFEYRTEDIESNGGRN